MDLKIRLNWHIVSIENWKLQDFPRVEYFEHAWPWFRSLSGPIPHRMEMCYPPSILLISPRSLFVSFIVGLMRSHLWVEAAGVGPSEWPPGSRGRGGRSHRWQSWKSEPRSRLRGRGWPRGPSGASCGQWRTCVASGRSGGHDGHATSDDRGRCCPTVSASRDCR